MLKILKSKFKNSSNNIAINNKNITIRPKTSGPITRNWKNSIYVYNKNTLSLLPEASRLTIKLIKSYFNFFSPKLEQKINNKKVIFFKSLIKKKIATSKILRKKNVSTSKIFISNGQFKHTNDLVNITIYFYNRQFLNYQYIILKLFKNLFNNSLFKNKILLIRKNGLRSLNKQIKTKDIMVNTLKIKNASQIKNIEYSQNIFYKNLIKKSIVKYRLLMYLKELILLNKFKFNNCLLQNITNLVKKIYRKNIQFNFINVKYFYLNSDILTESLVLKLRKNRKKLLKYLNTIIRKAKIKKIRWNPKFRYDFNEYAFKNTKKLDLTNNLLYDLFLQNKTKSKDLKKFIFNNIDYKRVSGIRLQAAGRLTRRNTASRSISKIKYKGSLVNINSSIKGYPYALLRGSLRPNLEFTKLNSKTRIGSFGIKGWIGGT